MIYERNFTIYAILILFYVFYIFPNFFSKIFFPLDTFTKEPLNSNKKTSETLKKKIKLKFPTPSYDLNQKKEEPIVDVIKKNVNPKQNNKIEKFNRGPCPQNMVLIENIFCIDQFEFPNMKGIKPFKNITYSSAKIYCQNAGKRLCSIHDLRNACQGKKKHMFPYGNSYIDGNCNTDNHYLRNYGNEVAHEGNEFLPAISQSGFYSKCVSSYGVYDLSGNLWEWTIDTKDGKVYLFGGGWASYDSFASCVSLDFSNQNSSNFQVGFRCCKDL